MLEEVKFQYLYNSSFFNVGLDDLDLYQGQKSFRQNHLIQYYLDNR